MKFGTDITLFHAITSGGAGVGGGGGGGGGGERGYYLPLTIDTTNLHTM